MKHDIKVGQVVFVCAKDRLLWRFQKPSGAISVKQVKGDYFYLDADGTLCVHKDTLCGRDAGTCGGAELSVFLSEEDWQHDAFLRPIQRFCGCGLLQDLSLGQLEQIAAIMGIDPTNKDLE